MLCTLSAALPPIHAQHQIEHTRLPMCKWISVDHTFAVEVSELKWSLLCQNWERRKKDLFSCKSYEPRSRRVPSLWSRTFFHRSLNYYFFCWLLSSEIRVSCGCKQSYFKCFTFIFGRSIIVLKSVISSALKWFIVSKSIRFFNCWIHLLEPRWCSYDRKFSIVRRQQINIILLFIIIFSWITSLLFWSPQQHQ